MSNVSHALALLDDEPDEAHQILMDVLRENPDDAKALFMVGTIYCRAERFGAALPVFDRVTRLAPRRSQGWNNLGMCYQECDRNKEARECFKRAFELEPLPDYMGNLATAYLQGGNYSESIRWARKTLEAQPGHTGATTALGFAQLATGDWEGWKGYQAALGGKFRKRQEFGAPDWDGSPVERLVLYGEQGLGDEIMYASCLPDAQKMARSIDLDCDVRLQGLFQRSFPGIKVHGTRRSAKTWATEYDAQAAVGALPSLFRPTIDSCPRTPYLVADPERRLQWRALFDSWGRKPVIGLAWSGGSIATQRYRRNVGLESFRPLIEVMDVHFVSLQYTDATAEIEATGLPVRHIHRATQSPDYDDTAAFVAELDFIIGPPTTVHHLAGALGKDSLILVPEKPMWDCAHGTDWPWYRGQKFHRQKAGESWADCIARIKTLERPC